MSLFKAAVKNVFGGGPRTASSPSQSKATAHSVETWSTSQLSVFQTSWLSIKNSLSSPTQRHALLEATSLKKDLDSMWECLATESNVFTSTSSTTLVPTSGAIGDCVQYFLQNDIPGNLVSLSLPDQPIGVKGLVINFFLSLVVFMDEQFVVNSKVHKPLVRLLRSCVEPELSSDDPDDGGWRTKESAYEEAVVEVMCHLCARIKTFPGLLTVFLQSRPLALNSHLIDSDSRSSSPLRSSTSTPPLQQNHNFSVTAQPAPRKSVHFSPQPSTSSATLSITPAYTNSSEPYNQPILASSRSSSLTREGLASRRLSPPLDSPANALKSDSDMLIFSYLLRFIHREGRTGDLARAGLLFLMELAMGRRRKTSDNQPKVATSGQPPDERRAEVDNALAVAFGEWILDSDFADVLGAGLGAAYGLLPSKLVITPRDSSCANNGGMVLGGMGTHLKSDSASDEQEAEEDERQQRRERLLIGLGVSGSDDFRVQIDLFLKLVQFAQDVLRNTSASQLDHYTQPSCSPVESNVLSTSQSLITKSDIPRNDATPNDPGPTPTEIVASAICSSVLSAIKTLFLNAIIYPSLLECSEYDGSAVAVMSYLEAILSLLETDGELADTLLRFLMTEDDDGIESIATLKSRNHERNINTSGQVIHLESAQETKARRRKSGVMQIIQADFNQARSAGGDAFPSDTGVTYFNSLGRFTLKDLLVNNIQSQDDPTATAALKLLHVILVRHDRYALPLLHILPDPTATAFPFPLDIEGIDYPEPGSSDSSDGLSSSNDEKGQDDGEEFVYPVEDAAQQTQNLSGSQNGDNDDEGEKFTYPGPETVDPDDNQSRLVPHMAGSPGRSAKVTPLSPGRSQASLGFQSSPCPTYQAHRDGLDFLAGLIDLIEPSRVVMRAESNQGFLSTAFGHYLLDAEAELTSTATFRRGLLSNYITASAVTSSRPWTQERGSQANPLVVNLLTAKKEADMDLIDQPVIRHRLSPTAPLTSALLESLAKFFVQPPELNLILTGCVATLASCPTRSLEGWMLPSFFSSHPSWHEQPTPLSTRPTFKQMADYDEGDDRSIDFEIIEYAANRESITPGSKDLTNIPFNRIDHESCGESILEVYQQLAEQVSGYRRTISGFDRYLKERRQGLIFVENLEDALDTTSNAFSVEELNKKLSLATSPSEQPKETNVQTIESPVASAQSKPRESSFFASLFKSASKSPPPVTSRPRSGTAASVGLSSTPDRATTFRPFSDHYQQTGSIKLTVVPVNTPATNKKSHLVTDYLSDDGTENDIYDGDGPDTPTKRTTNGHQLSEGARPNRISKMSLTSGDANTLDRDQVTPRQISLSMLLDNVVVLEEAIKELGAIISARRSLGIDPVRFL